MGNGIRLSPKHGVNATMGVCYFCGEPDGTIGLMGQLPGDAEAPRYAVISKAPCEPCQGRMKQGVILIGIEDGQKPGTEPKRTGHYCVVNDEGIRKVFADPVADEMIERRSAFIDRETMKAIGLLDLVEEQAKAKAATTTNQEGEPA